MKTLIKTRKVHGYELTTYNGREFYFGDVKITKTCGVKQYQTRWAVDLGNGTTDKCVTLGEAVLSIVRKQSVGA
jgi:hypothetical protein